MFGAYLVLYEFLQKKIKVQNTCIKLHPSLTIYIQLLLLKVCNY